MTIVIYKNNKMYSDTLLLRDDQIAKNILFSKLNIIKRNEDSYLLGCAGQVAACNKMLKVFKTIEDIEDIENLEYDIEFLVYSKKYKWLRQYSNYGNYIELDSNKYYAIGSGFQMANTIMNYDKNAKPKNVIKAICKTSRDYKGYLKIGF